MTTEFRYLMNLVGHGVQGKKPDAPPETLDWDGLFRFAYEQSIPILLAHALKMNPDIPCPEEVRIPAIASVRSAAIGNEMRRAQIIELLQAFEDAGIHAVLLKGYVVAEEFCAPECRLSEDADIWVSPDDEDRACAFLRSRGFAIAPRWKKGHHAVCRHPELGCVELHVILYDEIVEEVWFDKMDGSEFVREPHLKKVCGYGAYYTLGLTDHLIFLTLHMVKHLIISGMSLRMMLDVALYLKNHAAEVDVVRFWKTLHELRYDGCVQAILWAMVQYAGFAASDFPGLCGVVSEATEMLLDDLEIGGIMGIKDKKNREEGWYVYSRERMISHKSGSGYFLYMSKWQWLFWRHALFPTIRTLAEKYPVVREKPWYIPYAWMHRLIVRGFGGLIRGRIKTQIVVNPDKVNQTGGARVEMFRKLGML
jgi:hypothetical protein